MSDTTHEAPERIFATGMDRDPTGRWWHDKPLTGAIEYVRADLIAAHVAAALREAAETVRCSDFRHDAHDAILALIPDGGAALDRAVAAEREKGFWLGRSCGGSKAEIDAALAAIRNGEGK